ncbi:protein kinase domain-containing protein [Bremerella sp.]|uniref:serine/threonine-protein kinase n=1 Tax=Bremerella sp. TaxID=2795602 RepID=UPI00391BA8FA
MNESANQTELLERFERQWFTNPAPAIEHYLEILDQQDPQKRREFFLQLVACDMESRWKSPVDRLKRDQFPLRPLAEDYLSQYPEFGSPEEPPWDLVSLEFQTRQKWGDNQPDLASYVKKYPQWEQQLTTLAESSKLYDHTQSMETAAYTHPSESPKKQIGPYRLLRQLGEGGMGTVWLAEQDQPIRRRVALKIIKSGLDSQQVISRFEAERQALAMMDHPNIAKVLEAGTTELGTPYFVMELVEGQPITLYTEQHQLALGERLQLFLQACSAIQHSHQKGLIHRDIKPSNILVAEIEGTPTVKVIDFGLAKALQPTLRLSDRSMYTEFGQVLGTVRYMSPEQAGLNDLNVDTRSDVYSLGVVLYELLTGSTPLQSDTMRELALDRVLAAIREEDTPPPSQRLQESCGEGASPSWLRGASPASLKRILTKELDWIALKALEKNRSRRYESVSDLSNDVSCYLNDEPVSARPPTFGYRSAKFLRKHRAAMTSIFAGVAVPLLLLAALGLFMLNRLYQNSEEAAHIAVAAEKDANEKREEAEQERSKAEKLAADLETERDTLKATNIKLDEAVSEIQEANTTLAMNAKTIQDQNTVLEKQRDDLKTALVTVEQERNRATFAGMFAAVGLAKSSIEENDVASSLNLLADVPHEYRGWEWRHLAHLCHPEIATLKYDEQPTALAIAPDGSRVAVGVGEKGVILYEGLPTTENVKSQTISTNGQFVHTVQFAPDADRLWMSTKDPHPAILTVDMQGNVETVDWLFAEPQSTPSMVERIAFSNRLPEEGVLATEDSVYWINTKDKSSKRIYSADHIADIAWSTDGKNLVLAGEDHGVHFLVALEAAGPFSVQKRQELANKVLDCEPLRDGRVAFTTQGFSLCIWDPSNSRESVVSTLPARTTDLSYNPATEELAVSLLDSSIQIFEKSARSNEYRLLKVMRGHRDSVIALATNTNLGRTLSISEDRTLKAWEVDAYEDEEIITDADAILCSAVSLDGRSYVTGNRAGITRAYQRVTEAVHAPMAKPSGHERWRRIPLENPYAEMADISIDPILVCGLSDNAQEVFSVSQGGMVCWWSLDSGKVTDRLQLEIQDIHCGHYQGGRLAIGSDEGGFQVIEINSRSIVARSQLTGRVDAICLQNNPDSPVLVATSQMQEDEDGESRLVGRLQLIGVADGKPTVEPFAEHDGRFTSLALSASDDRLAAGSSDSAIRLWTDTDMLDLPRIQPTLLEGHHAGMTSLAFSPNSERLVSGDDNGRLILWFLDRPVAFADPQGAAARLHVQQLVSLSRHHDAITSIKFSVEGDRLISTGRDGRSIIRLADQRELN